MQGSRKVEVTCENWVNQGIDERKRISGLINDILEKIEVIGEIVEGISFEEFEKDKIKTRAVTRSFEIIGEASKNISDSIKEKYPEVSWRDLIDMRNKISHHYFGVDFVVIWDTIFQDLPPLKVLISEIVRELKDERDRWNYK